jgi:hypothetical protein
MFRVNLRPGREPLQYNDGNTRLTCRRLQTVLDIRHGFAERQYELNSATVYCRIFANPRIAHAWQRTLLIR